MAFELKDGTLLLIHNDDVKEIADKIFFSAILDINNPNIMLNTPVDLNLERVKTIQEILSESEDISDEIRQNYYKQMLALLSEKGELKENTRPMFETTTA